MKRVFAILVLTAASAFAQNRALVLDASNRVVTGITNGDAVTLTNDLNLTGNRTLRTDYISGTTDQPITLFSALQFDDVESADIVATTRTNLGLGWAGTNASTTVSNLFASNSLPSGAAPAGAVNTADGSGGSAWVASNVYFTRQATNSPQTTNSTSYITNGVTLTLSNVPAGTYLVNGMMTSDASTTREWAVNAPHNTLSPRAILGWFSSGTASGFFGSSTNAINNADGATGVRVVVINGALVLTNSGSVTWTVRVPSGGTNFVQVLQDSFLRLIKVN